MLCIKNFDRKTPVHTTSCIWYQLLRYLKRLLEEVARQTIRPQGENSIMGTGHPSANSNAWDCEPPDHNHAEKLTIRIHPVARTIKQQLPLQLRLAVSELCTPWEQPSGWDLQFSVGCRIVLGRICGVVCPEISNDPDIMLPLHFSHPTWHMRQPQAMTTLA